PAVLVDQVVPLGDQVPQRTAVVAERDTAVHAAAGLGLQGLVRELVLVDLFPVQQPQRNRAPGGQLPLGVLQKSLRISHVRPPSSRLSTTRRRLDRVSLQPRAASMIASSTSFPAFSASEMASRTFLYSRGMTFTKWFTCCDQSLRMRSATAEPVLSRCSVMVSRSQVKSSPAS